MATGGAALTSSTPDALWGAPALRALRPTAIAASDLSRGRLLDRCNLSVPVGMRLLVVGDPDASASMLLRVLAGLSRPSRGRVELAGMQDGSLTGWGSRVAHLRARARRPSALDARHPVSRRSPDGGTIRRDPASGGARGMSQAGIVA